MRINSCDHLLDSSGKVHTSHLVVSFDKKEVLNSNSIPGNNFFLAKLKKDIRTQAATCGSLWHPQSVYSEGAVELSRIIGERNAAKSKARKEMNKDGIPAEQQQLVFREIEQDYTEIIADLKGFKDENVKYLYDKCAIKIGVSPPSKRRIDPPNMYPTVKPFIDGLTDAGWWEDDNYNYIISTEFHYVKPNPYKSYVFHFTIENRSDNGVNNDSSVNNDGNESGV